MLTFSPSPIHLLIWEISAKSVLLLQDCQVAPELISRRGLEAP